MTDIYSLNMSANVYVCDIFALSSVIGHYGPFYLKARWWLVLDTGLYGEIVSDVDGGLSTLTAVKNVAWIYCDSTFSGDIPVATFINMV